jgi:hypothetical protein
MKPPDAPTLIHYSAQPLTAVQSVDPAAAHQPHIPPWKPRGLWVSVGDDWEQWCRGENFQLARLAHRAEIVLHPDAKILRLTNAGQIRLFTRMYALPTDGLPGYRAMMQGIDWPKVGTEWQGIVIAPYCWECRLGLDTFWYYGWDCACGAIWDADAIQELRAPTRG